MNLETYGRLFEDFVSSGDTLRVYHGGKVIFASREDKLTPLLEYVAGFASCEGIVVFDRIMGNSAALLAVKAGCSAVYSPLGSELATRTLDRYGIAWHVTRVVPFIEKPGGGMCPMEKLSLGKEPEEFYAIVTGGVGTSGGMI